MTAFEPILITRRPASVGPGTIGRFVVPDIDAPRVPLEDLPDPALLAEAAVQSRLADAHEAGFAAGEALAREAAAASQAAREAAALETIATAMLTGAASARSAAGEAALDLARLLLAALDAALPEAAARLAPEAAAGLAAELAPLLDDGIAVTLRVAPGTAAAAAARIGQTALTIVEDESLPAGDAAAAWRGGGATLDLDTRRQAIATVLSAFDLQEN